MPDEDAETENQRRRLSAVTQALTSLSYDFEAAESGFIIKGRKLKGREQRFPQIYLLVLERGIIAICSIDIPSIASDRKVAVSEALHVINERLPYGSFEFNQRAANRIAFKVSSFIGSERVNHIQSVIANMLSVALLSISVYRKNIIEVNDGALNPADAGKVKGEVMSRPN